MIHCMRDVGVTAGRSRSVQSTAAPSRLVPFSVDLVYRFYHYIL